MNLTEYSYGEKAVCDIVAPSSALRITSKRHIKRVFDSVVVVTFQIAFRAEIHANGVFLFLKNHF